MAMATVSFDTRRFSRKLEQSGFIHDQAVGVAEAFADASGDTLATKANVGDAVTQLRVELREMELRLTMRMAGLAVATVAAIVALDKLI